MIQIKAERSPYHRVLVVGNVVDRDVITVETDNPGSLFHVDGAKVWAFIVNTRAQSDEPDVTTMISQPLDYDIIKFKLQRADPEAFKLIDIVSLSVYSDVGYDPKLRAITKPMVYLADLYETSQKYYMTGLREEWMSIIRMSFDPIFRLGLQAHFDLPLIEGIVLGDKPIPVRFSSNIFFIKEVRLPSGDVVILSRNRSDDITEVHRNERR